MTWGLHHRVTKEKKKPAAEEIKKTHKNNTKKAKKTTKHKIKSYTPDYI